MTARARVERVRADRTVDLRILAPPPCSGCEGACLWGRAPVSALRVRSSLRHRPGELVSVSLKHRHFLQGALLMHGLPWAGLLAGAGAGWSSQGGDLGSLLGALTGLGAGLLAGRRLQHRWRVSPTVAAVLQTGRK